MKLVPTEERFTYVKSIRDGKCVQVEIRFDNEVFAAVVK